MNSVVMKTRVFKHLLEMFFLYNKDTTIIFVTHSIIGNHGQMSDEYEHIHCFRYQFHPK